MINVSDKSMCCGCGVCSNVCLKQCIKMNEDSEGFFYPSVTENACIHCNLCDRMCPVINSTESKEEVCSEVFAATNKDELIRLNSSSGGVFSALAASVLNRGGVVWGAAFNDDFSVEHKKIDNIKDIAILRGTKYVQSNTYKAYPEIKKDLSGGVIVLFAGTPCQVEGLLSFLGKKYDNLITIDFVCHGVPSNLIWQKYINQFGVPLQVNFRDKKTGWRNYSITLSFQKKIISESHNDNPYMKAFLYNYTLRPSCYSCKFKKEDRLSDITLADFWGAWEIAPDENDDKGLSAVFVHSDVGKRALENASNDLQFVPIDYKRTIEKNPAYIEPARRPEDREEFLEILLQGPFDSVIKTKFRVSAKHRIKNFIRQLIK